MSGQLRSAAMREAEVTAWPTDDPDRVALWFVTENGESVQYTVSRNDAVLLRWKLGRLLGGQSDE